ncbi:YfiM family lipoprotein [Vitreoscilla massiliensis]|uniref:YfiM family lipoprotein n=1 Tax=Vitreoscilla massiliensis TaxID=1689272 RepID=A0ABY4E0V9_9NEIS|nr:YfiM family lipoprotein [Vitreoscilla massiliensis]UOO89423.1 YfiM family lipoprotein [Vitreoscilla massiliensis]
MHERHAYRPLLKVFTLLCLLLCNACTTFHYADDAWTGRDKAKHFAVSAALSAAATHAAANHSDRRGQQAAIGIGVSLALGTSKELRDARGGGSGFSWRDMAYNVAGALTGYGLYRATQ